MCFITKKDINVPKGTKKKYFLTPYFWREVTQAFLVAYAGLRRVHCGSKLWNNNVLDKVRTQRTMHNLMLADMDTGSFIAHIKNIAHNMLNRAGLDITYLTGG